jgi:hypothetical protein
MDRDFLACDIGMRPDAGIIVTRGSFHHKHSTRGQAPKPLHCAADDLLVRRAWAFMLAKKVDTFSGLYAGDR